MMLKKIPKSELKKYIQEYHEEFPGWTLVKNEYMVRTQGPIAQLIWFENLSIGEYRPATCVQILIAPEIAMLHQFLDVRHREISPKQHYQVFHSIIKAMEEQFVPNIRVPLDIVEVCRICEREAIDNLNDANALSALHAYLGEIEKARIWISKFEVALKNCNEKNTCFYKEYIHSYNEIKRIVETNVETQYFENNILNSTNKLLGYT